MSKPGRNDSCPCGSGKKYKKCCLAQEAALRPAATPEREQHFITELGPDPYEEADRLLRRLEEGEGSRVKSELEALYRRHPGRPVTNYVMGLYRAQVEEDIFGAIPFFEKAVEIVPSFALAHFNLGIAASAVGSTTKAVTAFRMAERCSRDGDGIAEKAREKLQELEKMVARVSSLPSLDAYLALTRLFDEAYQCLAGRQFEQAVELFGRVLGAVPRHVQAHNNLALAHAGLGRRSEALASLDRALELDPGYEPAVNNRRNISQMREGEPFKPEGGKEMRYYSDRLREKAKRDLSMRAELQTAPPPSNQVAT